MTKKLLAAGSVLFLGLLLAGCGTTNDTYVIGEESANTPSSQEAESTEKPSPGNENQKDTVANNILETEKNLTINAEENITGSIQSSLDKINQTFGTGKINLNDFMKSFQPKANIDTLVVDAESKTATVEGKTTLEGSEYPTTFKYVYVDNQWKLDDFSLTNAKGEQYSVSVIIEAMVQAK